MSDNVENLLHEAFSPVEPPPRLTDRVEARLERISHAAFEELHDWELAAMRDPRNWVRPVAALAVGTGAGAALVVMHLRSRKKRSGQRSGTSPIKAPLASLGQAIKRSTEEQRRHGKHKR